MVRYSVEHQRNIAYDLLELKSKNIKISTYFQPDKPVIIYGFDFIGREIYNEIKDKVKTIFFVDRAHDGEFYDGVAIYSLKNNELRKISTEYDEILLLIMIMSDEEVILKDVKGIIPNIQYHSLYNIFAFCKLKYDGAFKAKQNKRTLQLLNDIIEDKNSNLRQIVLVGTAYTELLSMMYIGEWQDSLYIMERYIDGKIVDRMQERDMLCLYEENPVEYYDLTYVIAKYAINHDIKVYGHDHMRLSRAFLNNKVTVIEDGLANYDFKYSENYSCTLDNGRQYYPLGYDFLVEKVILTGQFEVPQLLLGKTEIISPPQLWDKLTEKQKDELIYIFDFPYNELKKRMSGKESIIFLTEPCISDGEVIRTHEKQIAIYKRILENYPKSQVIIKPHPADDIDYFHEFPEYYILGKQFPVQIISWFQLGVCKYIIMKESSCLNIFKKICDVDVYDGDRLVTE